MNSLLLTIKPYFVLALWVASLVFSACILAGKPLPVIDKKERVIVKKYRVIQLQDLAEVLANLPKNQKITDQEKTNICQSRPGMAPEMVMIPAGSFMMGSPITEKDRSDDEDPQH